MITAVQEHERQRQRTRSAASGPAFTVPSMPGLDVIPYASAPSCAAPTPPPAQASALSNDLSSYIGRSVGSGQCVALVKAANPTLGPASLWTSGAAVQGNTALTPGTPIATFSGTGQYANATDGSSHAAIYLGQNHQGMVVLDQWSGSQAAVRTIPWSNPGAVAANTGSAFRVVVPSA